MKHITSRIVVVFVLLIGILTSNAQTTGFSYQGSLKNGGVPANGSYDFEFRLFDSAAAGTQIGSLVSLANVAVTNGIFSVTLDFGDQFPNANRFLDVRVRTAGGGAFTPLTPREQIKTVPYAVKSLNSEQLGGVNASEYITSSNVGNTVIRNQTTQQAGSNFNISGNGVIGGSSAFGGAPVDGNFRLNSFGPIRSFSNTSTQFVAETTGGTNSWARYYMRSTNRSWFMGTSQNFNGDQLYIVDDTAGQIRMTISTDGYVGINTSPQAGLDMRGTGLQTQQRITDNTSGNSLVMQAGAGNNMKVTGYNYNTNTAVPLYLSTDGANTVMNSGGGNILQPGSGFGMPKAMLFVLANGTISRCWNGVTGSNTGNCGFTVAPGGVGLYDVNFGFTVNNRFASLTASGGVSQAISCRIQGFFNSTTMVVRAFETNTNNDIPSDFYLIVY